jgi:hypothetical protein
VPEIRAGLAGGSCQIALQSVPNWRMIRHGLQRSEYQAVTTPADKKRVLQLSRATALKPMFN